MEQNLMWLGIKPMTPHMINTNFWYIVMYQQFIIMHMELKKVALTDVKTTCFQRNIHIQFTILLMQQFWSMLESICSNYFKFLRQTACIPRGIYKVVFLFSIINQKISYENIIQLLCWLLFWHMVNIRSKH